MYVELPYDTEPQIQLKLQSARQAFEKWRRTPLQDRIAVIREGLSYFEAHRDQIAEEISSQMGKPIAQSHNEFGGFFERANTMLEIAPQALESDLLPPLEGFYRRIDREPLGVVLDIAAWNYPLLIAVNVIVPALAAGNSVLIKHSAKTPLCGVHFEKAFGGQVPGLVQNLILNHKQTLKIIRTRALDHVVFTGSVPGGREVYRAVAECLIAAGLELGGKDPAYVAEDADLAFATANIVDGGCYNAGQSCCAIERVYVHRKHYDAFIDQARQVMSTYRLGDPLDKTVTMGPLATSTTIQLLDAQIRSAQDQGARMVLGGKRMDQSPGNFYLPTLLVDVPNDADIMQEENFGPVLPVCPVENDAKALKMMNASRYGLTASVWTSDRRRAEWFASRLNTGTVYQNRCDYLDPALPWTGVGESGFGVSLSRYGFHHLTRCKSIHFRTGPIQG
ncbi:MAG: aldehyde dehydrogenase [Deltaproteobacteria bacterium SG8_13]|nr:MAG: aldehyde dehydrogenase [Deltaproteobacteria bacterium SG8_13]